MLAQNVHTGCMLLRRIALEWRECRPPPPAIILSVIAYWHSMCAPGSTSFSHFPIPSKGVWGFAPCLSSALALSHPNGWERRACRFCPRRFSHPNDRNAEPAGFARAAFHTRMIGTQSLPVPHAPPAADLPESACSHRMCMSGKTAFSHFPIPSKGVWGFAPCLSLALALPHPHAKLFVNLATSQMRL